MAMHAHETHTEQALLGAVLSGQPDASNALLTVPPEAFYQPKHQLLASVLRDMIARQEKIDAQTVLAKVQDLGLLRRVGDGPGLFALTAAIWHIDYVAIYAARLVELYGRRRLSEEFQRGMQYLDMAWDAGEQATPLADTILSMRATLDEVGRYSDVGQYTAPMTVHDLIHGRDTWDWLVPGLMERGDRLVITGEEGLGKSELVAQLVLCMAAGIHPFTSEDLGERRVKALIIDCENSISQSRRRLRRIVGAVDSTRAAAGLPETDWAKSLHVEFRTGGLDLLKGSDAAWLEQIVSSVGPDILSIGPLYKLHRGDLNNELEAGQLAGILDGIRERHGCAIITEAHAGHGKDGQGDRMMRPRGSALFVGWPEFGFGLRAAKSDDGGGSADLVPWRGSREERSFPTGLVRGHSGLLPWRPNNEYWDRPEVFFARDEPADDYLEP